MKGEALKGRRAGDRGLDAALETTAALSRLLVRRIGAEWRSTAIYGDGLNRAETDPPLAVPPKGFPSPRFRNSGRQILLGRLTLCGVTLEIGPGVAIPGISLAPRALSPWSCTASPGLPSLLAQGQAGRR